MYVAPYRCGAARSRNAHPSLSHFNKFVPRPDSIALAGSFISTAVSRHTDPRLRGAPLLPYSQTRASSADLKPDLYIESGRQPP